MTNKIIVLSLTAAISTIAFAADLPKCEIRIGSKPNPSTCFRWKDSSGSPADSAAMEKRHIATFHLPNGKTLSVPAKHNYLLSEKGIVQTADFFVTDEDLTYSNAVDFMIETFKKMGLYDSIPKNSLDAIDAMKNKHGEIRYPGLYLGSTNVSATVKTLTPSKDKDVTAKIWHVRFSIFENEQRTTNESKTTP